MGEEWCVLCASVHIRLSAAEDYSSPQSQVSPGVAFASERELPLSVLIIFTTSNPNRFLYLPMLSFHNRQIPMPGTVAWACIFGLSYLGRNLEWVQASSWNGEGRTGFAGHLAILDQKQSQWPLVASFIVSKVMPVTPTTPVSPIKTGPITLAAPINDAIRLHWGSGACHASIMC